MLLASTVSPARYMIGAKIISADCRELPSRLAKPDLMTSNAAAESPDSTSANAKRRVTSNHRGYFLALC